MYAEVTLCAYTAWHHIMAQISSWHKTEVKIFNNNCSLLPILVHFHIPNKEVKVTTEIIKISSAISICKMCKLRHRFLADIILLPIKNNSKRFIVLILCQ